MLNRPRHVVTVQNRRLVRGAHGTEYRLDGDPVEVPCTVRSSSATETNTDGLQVSTLKRVIARTWPGDVHSLITFRGDEYEPQGDPQEFDGSERTTHWEILIQRVKGA